MNAALATFFGILGAGAAFGAFTALVAAVSTLHGSMTRRLVAAATCVVLAALFIALSVYFAGAGS